MVNLIVEEPNQGADEESNRFQMIGDVWEYLRVLYKIQYEAQHHDILRYVAFVMVVINLNCIDFQGILCLPTTLDVKIGCTIFCVKDVIPSAIMLLEGRNAQEC